MTEREQFEAWMKSRGTSFAIEHPQAFEAWVAAKSIEREACARLCEKMAEARFADYGTREHDTGASYYRGRASEEYEARDEENNNCAAAIRSRSNATATAAEPAIDAAMKSPEAGGCK